MLRSPIHLRPTTHVADATRFQSTIADLTSPPLPFMPSSPLPAPSNRDYVLKFRQQPRQARMCGVGDKADRRPIDPPPVVQLTVVEKTTLGASTKGNQHLSARDKATAASSSRSRQKDATSGVEDQAAGQTYLQNPYYLMNATLVQADDQQDLHLLKDGKTRYTLGSTVSSLFQLKDEDKSDAGFFVFPDLSVRVEGDFRLKLDLYEIVADELHYCKTIMSDVFQVYTAKRFPGNQQSTSITKLLSSQGIKVRTHHAAAPSRPASSRKLSTSSSKRKVDMTGQDLGSSAMVKSESSESSIDRHHGGLERRESGASSKRPRTAGLDPQGGRPSSSISYESSRPGSYHSQHDPRAAGHHSWGAPIEQSYPPQPPQYYGGPPPHPSAYAPPPPHPSTYAPPPPAHYAPSADPRAYRDPRAEEAWRRSREAGPMDVQPQQRGPPPPPVDLSRPTLPPLSSFRSGEPVQQTADGHYYRPPSSSAAGAPPHPHFADPRHGSLGGSSESSLNRSSMSSVMSERYSVSSERPSISSDRYSLSSDPSSYGPNSVPPDAYRMGGAMGPPYDSTSRYPSAAARNSSLPSIQSMAVDDDPKRPSQQQQSHPSDAFRPASFASGGESAAGALAPSLSTVPRLPSLSEMMSQPSMRIGELRRSLSPLDRPTTATSRPGSSTQQAPSPGLPPTSSSGRMGLSNLLASPPPQQ